MVEEHIKVLLESTNEEINYLEEQINGLQKERGFAEKWMEDLKKDHSLEKTIFSPRSHQNFTVDTVVDAQEKLASIQNNIAAVQKQMDAALKRKQEIEALLSNVEVQPLQEVQQAAMTFLPGEINKGSNDGIEYDCKRPDPEKKHSNERENAINEDFADKWKGKEENTAKFMPEGHMDSDKMDISGIVKSVSMVSEGIMKARFLEMLKDLHKQSEICGALMNGNRNGKQQLREMTKTIKKYAEEIENF